MHNQGQITDPISGKGIAAEGGCVFVHLCRRQSEHWPLHHLSMSCSCQIMTTILHGKGSGIGTRSKLLLHQPPTAIEKKIGSTYRQMPPECCSVSGIWGLYHGTGFMNWEKSIQLRL